MSERWFRYRGHRVIFNTETGATLYEDGTPLRAEERACTACGRAAGRGEPDPCLGLLAGVDQACCGHGFVESAYVGRRGRRVLTGEAAIDEMIRQGAMPAPLVIHGEAPALVEQLQIRCMAWMQEMTVAFRSLGEVPRAFWSALPLPDAKEPG